MNKKLLALSLFMASAFGLIQADCGQKKKCDTSCAQSINLWQPHAFSAYCFRDIIQKKTFYTNQSDREEWNGMLSVAPEYMQNFGGKCGTCKSLGARPFWSGTNEMTYGTNNGESDIDAYQFGMGNVVGQGAIQLNPQFKHVGADIMLHFAQHKDKRGLVFTLQAPIGAMMIDTKLKEVVANPDDIVDTAWINYYPAPDNRYQTMTQAWQGGSVNCSNNSVQSSRYKPIALLSGRMASCKQTVMRMADLSAMIGYKVYGSEKGFVDIGFKVSCPTGNTAQSEFILEPIFGREGHWGVGGEVTSHYKIWESKNADKGVDFWFEGQVLHLFSGKKPSMRSFDLALNGNGSKYMLIQYYFPGNPSTGNPTGRIPSFVTNAVNVTTMPVISTFGAEGSAAVGFDFYKDNWNLMIGGEFWGRSKECLSLDFCNMIKERSANLNDFAVLGRQISEDDRSISVGSILNLHLCEPAARINKSQNVVLGVGVPPAVLTYPAPLPEGIKDARVASNRIPADLNVALDVAGAAAAAAMTGKVFSQFGYTFKEHRYTPNISVFSSVEFASNNNAASLWSIGTQASLNF
ncbi:MAG: hypothetical protein NTZ68_03920 [Candidatus Dependentiae bacterium]|nr:hypothetical protein [Candidatus Dependentiae bacterium]